MLDPSLHVGGARAARRSSGAGGKFLIRGRGEGKNWGPGENCPVCSPPPLWTALGGAFKTDTLHTEDIHSE